YEALLAEESVDQGALADVRATHDRQANRPLALLFGLLLDGKRLGQGADHRIEKSGYAAAVLGGDGGDVGNSQRVELGQMAAQLALFGIDLVDGEEDRLAAAAQKIGDLLVDGSGALHPVDDEDHRLGLVDGQKRLIA